ncbi:MULTISPECIES: hypothetical protein [unclassified Duganella]|uniref:hypothetical protein n=1 Tax=unclassified Duganella TaxID=2636909 RepID=UPI000887AE60|nr:MULTISPECIES: hypothetical protein [unclassified Duganella]SDF53621.1 hypothetical protein SAMN05216320_101501 [Duganella sp. OV458]SDI73836.1 hypothetical protein SAMN05428973_101920 [Duganella sp. OV510]
MKNKLAICLLTGCLTTGAWAQQADPDPSVKTGDGKAAQTKQSDKRADKHPCTSMQGGVDASGAETVEAHAKTGKASQANACGKDNGKASSPHAAPTTPNPDVKR